MRLKQLGIPLAVAVAASACHHAPPAVAVQPQIDSSALERARPDSIARAEEAARAREAAARRAEQRRADSLAALQRKSQEIGGELASMIHFDFDRAILRPGDVQVLDEKLPILRDNPRGIVTSAAPTSTTWHWGTAGPSRPSNTSWRTASTRAASRSCPTGRRSPSILDITRRPGRRTATTSSRTCRRTSCCGKGAGG